MASIDSLMYSDITGICRGSKSLAGRDNPLNPLRLYSLSKTNNLAGGTLTWGVIKSRGILWGADQSLLYAEPQEGYSYHWNLNTSLFSVTDSSGNVTTYPAKQLKDLRISWGILKSPQFALIYAITTNADVFLQCARLPIIRDDILSSVGTLMSNDYLAEGIQHILFDRLADYKLPDPVGEWINISSYSSGGDGYNPITEIDNSMRSILLSKAEYLQSTNAYPLDLLQVNAQYDSGKQEREFDAHQYENPTYLMIALFAQNLLSTDSNITYEPWMLWAAFQWYVNTAHSAANSRKIFDLSPRW